MAWREKNGFLAQVLTAREREIALWVSQGLSNKEVGRYLDLVEGTVKIHLHKIYRKIGVPNRTALVSHMQTREKLLDSSPFQVIL